MMKYKNKDGIELSYTQRGNAHTDLVKEVVGEVVTMLEEIDNPSPAPPRAHHRLKIREAINFLKINFDILF